MDPSASASHQKAGGHVVAPPQKRRRSPNQREVAQQGDKRHLEFQYEKKGVWTKYDDMFQGILGETYEEGMRCLFDPNTCVPSVNLTIHTVTYVVDFQLFKQINLATGHERRIRLIVS
jgi:hypothetical protein